MARLAYVKIKNNSMSASIKLTFYRCGKDCPPLKNFGVKQKYLPQCKTLNTHLQLGRSAKHVAEKLRCLADVIEKLEQSD